MRGGQSGARLSRGDAQLIGLPVSNPDAAMRTSTHLPTPEASTVLRPLDDEVADALGVELRALLADVFALYLKTKGFHWHVRGAHFRDRHLLLDEQAAQLFAMTDALAERARTLGAPTLLSIGDIARHQRLRDNDDPGIAPDAMLGELCDDNLRLARALRSAHGLFDRNDDFATASLVETWLDETERRAWFLREILAR